MREYPYRLCNVALCLESTAQIGKKVSAEFCDSEWFRSPSAEERYRHNVRPLSYQITGTCFWSQDKLNCFTFFSFTSSRPRVKNINSTPLKVSFQGQSLPDGKSKHYNGEC